MLETIGTYAAYMRDQAAALAQNIYELEVTQQTIEFSRGVVQTAQNIVEASTALGVIAGKEIEKITNEHLPAKFAEVVQRAFNGSGVFAAEMLLPAPVVNVSFFTYYASTCFYTPSPRLARNISDGIALSYAYYTSRNIVSYAMDPRPVHLVSACVNACFMLCFAWSWPDETSPDTPPDQTATAQVPVEATV